MKWLVICYWMLFSFAAIGLASEGPSFPWQVLLVALWLLLWRFQKPVRRFLFGRGEGGPTPDAPLADGAEIPPLARPSPPPWVWYFGLGLLYTVVVGENLGIGFRGDIHPNLAVNSLLWVGSYLGLLVGWWILARRYLWTPWQVYWLSGLIGLAIEQNYLIPRMLVRGEVIEAFLLAPFIHAVYGSIMAPLFAILGPYLPVHDRRPGIGAKLLALLLPSALFFLGGLWIFLWFWLVPSWRQ
jgi:hypothetical protein